MSDVPGVWVAPVLAGRVADWILAGLYGELAQERDRGGTPFPTGPYVRLVRHLRQTARLAGAGHDLVTEPPDGGWLDVAALSTMAGRRDRSARSLRRDCASGRIPATKINGRWLIPQGDPQ